jgi:hypothetical protein
MTRRKGQSGTVEEVERLAQTQSTAAIDTLARLMRSSRSPAVRLAAANALLDRAWGKPRQQDDVLPPSEAVLAPDATLLIVREHIVWERHSDGSGFSEPRWVPVCEGCVKPQEASGQTQKRTCPGCNRVMLGPPNWKRRTCCRRCQQRVRRVWRRAFRPAKHCAVCASSFAPKRSDARFCSAACKQAAWRRLTAR